MTADNTSDISKTDLTFSVSSYMVSFNWSINPNDRLSKVKISQILCSVWGSVVVVVASLSMVRETMKMLHTKIKTLKRAQEKFLCV